MRKKLFEFIYKLLAPITYLSAMWLKKVMKKGLNKYEDNILMKIGLLPIVDHYYNPLINPKKYLTKKLTTARYLPGISFNIKEQLDLLSKFNYNNELLLLPMEKNNENSFFYKNNSFGSGDAEYFYSIIRYFEPKRIIEIGSGNSTLLVREAIKKIKKINPSHDCDHICIEPFEQPWLESLSIKVLRKKVEIIELSFFDQLQANDILFIDSSHVIRPQGDVLYEYLEIIPNLNSGVLIHLHDIFTPRDYLDDWIINKHLMWNEQYLFEALLTHNKNLKVIGSLNYLAHNYQDKLAEKCPIFAKQPNRELGSFWIQKI